jgi:PKD repeat protein
VAYGGHPTIPGLTAIAPVLTLSRATGAVPLVVQVHAADTTATFSDGGAAFLAAVNRAFDPYLDLEFSWDFGDAAGTETFTDPILGEVNANTDQTGPAAAYVYRTPGSYTITLTARGWNGSAYVTASTTTLRVGEVQMVELKGTAGGSPPTAGTWTLTYDGETATLPYNATARQIQAALEALPGIGEGNVDCRGNAASGALFCYFQGERAGEALDLLTADGSGLTGAGATPVIVTRLETGATAAVATCSAWTGADCYFDSVGGSDASPGTLAQPKQTFAALKSWVEGGADRRAFLKRGSQWDFDGVDIRWNYANPRSRVHAYGVGAAPRFYLTDAGTHNFMLVGSSGYGGWCEDVVIDGLAIDATTSVTLTSRAALIGPTGNGDYAEPWHVLRHFAFIDSDWIGAHNCGLQWSGGYDLTLWRCNSTSGPEGTAFSWSVGIDRYFAAVGGTQAGDGRDAIKHHPFYPTIGAHALFRWLDFPVGEGRNYAVNGNAPDVSNPDALCWTLIGCDVAGPRQGFDFSNTNNEKDKGRIDRIVIADNRVHTPLAGIWAYSPTRIVCRDNTWCCGSYDINIDISETSFPNWTTPTHLSYYRNRSWKPAASHLNETWAVFAAGNHPWGLGGDAGGYVVSNVFATDQAGPGLTRMMEFWPARMSNWTIAGNQYYAPNQSDPWRSRPSGAFLDFADWQATGYETGATYSDPAWPDPVGGDFGDGAPPDPPTPVRRRLNLRWRPA